LARARQQGPCASVPTAALIAIGLGRAVREIAFPCAGGGIGLTDGRIERVEDRRLEAAKKPAWPSREGKDLTEFAANELI